MKKEILLIVTLILVEICIMYGKMIYNLTDSYIIIIVFAIIFLIGNVFLWKRNKESSNKKGYIVIIVIFIILTILKISYVISIKYEQNQIKQTMQKIDESVSKSSSFEELCQIANVTEEKVNNFVNDFLGSGLDLYMLNTNNTYIYSNNFMKYIKDVMILPPIHNVKLEYNNSYSKFKKVKKGILYGQEYIDIVDVKCKEFLQVLNIIVISSIIYELVLISVFYGVQSFYNTKKF